MPERALAEKLLKKVNKAVRECDLIGHGDRIVVAVSGGRDSLSLLQLLHMRQRSVPVDQFVGVAKDATSFSCCTCASAQCQRRLT